MSVILAVILCKNWKIIFQSADVRMYKHRLFESELFWTCPKQVSSQKIWLLSYHAAFHVNLQVLLIHVYILIPSQLLVTHSEHVSVASYLYFCISSDGKIIKNVFKSVKFNKFSHTGFYLFHMPLHWLWILEVNCDISNKCFLKN